MRRHQPGDRVHLRQDRVDPVALGEEARVALPTFSLDGPERRNLRRVHRKSVQEGCSFEVVPPERVAPLVPELRAISDEWMAEKNAGHSTGPGLGVELDDSKMADKLDHEWKNREEYDADDHSVMDW